MPVDCRNCGSPVADELRDCVSCGTANGFPNVRIAERIAETEALDRRVSDATVSARARKCEDALKRFGHEIQRSRAVMARPVAIVQNIAFSDTSLYAGHLTQLQAKTKTTDGGELDKVRPQFEQAVSPNFADKILYACLTLDDKWLTAFGECGLFLNETHIDQRSTVFEENPVNFFRKQKLTIGSKVPPGFRATWASRDKLAIAKLAAELSEETSPKEYQDILLRDGSDTVSSDYIEVHIYGTINRRSVKRVVCRRPKARADLAILKKMAEEFKPVGVALEMVG